MKKMYNAFMTVTLRVTVHANDRDDAYEIAQDLPISDWDELDWEITDIEETYDDLPRDDYDERRFEGVVADEGMVASGSS